MTAAKYIRLSSADENARYGEKAESGSVTHQRMLLDRYIAERAEFEGCAVLEFLDDGRSGTNFDRPGVQALLNAAKHRQIDCILVKDFTRFGRNSLEVDNYIEQVFPFLGIRFISVNDGYDSRDYPHGSADDLGNGIRTLMGEMYSRNLSQKSKAAKRQYAQRGQIITPYPIYGYVKPSEDKRTWVPDPDAAPVVKRVFERFLDGLTATEIAGELNAQGVPSPFQHKRDCQRHFKMSFFAEIECRFLRGGIQVLYSLIHHITCRLEARQALIYQLVSGLTGENGEYNYSKAVHLYPPFFDIFCSPKNYKIASALTASD